MMFTAFLSSFDVVRIWVNISAKGTKGKSFPREVKTVPQNQES